MKIFLVLSSLLSLFLSNIALAEGTLSDNIRIESKALGYALQYRVYVPEGLKPGDKVPTIYMVDGQWYISGGKMVKVLDKEISEGNIKPVIAVFVDSRNPDSPAVNRRQKQFFCNKQYANFFKNELVAEITTSYPVSAVRDDRVILGLSFGAYNAACFGLMANDAFKGIAMQSPANTDMINRMAVVYRDVEKQDIKVFMSVGTVKDNTKAGRFFKQILLAKGYDLTYKEVRSGHSWSNWRPLLDDVLITFFGRP